jgi:hypothetical protein
MGTSRGHIADEREHYFPGRLRKMGDRTFPGRLRKMGDRKAQNLVLLLKQAIAFPHFTQLSGPADQLSGSVKTTI